MLIENIYYQEEKNYTSTRLAMIIVATIVSLAVYTQTSGNFDRKILYIVSVLMGLSIFSILEYIFMVYLPETLVSIRKNILIFLDLIILTYFMIIFEKNGLFLLPLYIILVMRNGFSFGIEYFYMSIVLAGISWGTIIKYSEYWVLHTDIIAVFAITTLVIPMFYLNLITRVHEKNDELSKELVDTEYDANYDTLTGIANRKMYKEYMKKLMKTREPFALYFIDLNKFKAINDTHGHAVGDRVLQEAVSRLSKAISDDDFIARLGGDEFVIVTSRKKAFLKKFTENIGSIAIGKHKVNGVTVLISLSIGISIYPDDASDEMMLSKYADEAMYKAKKDANTFYKFYGNSIQEEVPKSKNWV